MVVTYYQRAPPKSGRFYEGRGIRNPPDAVDVLFADHRQGLRAADRPKGEEAAYCATELMKLNDLSVWMLSNVETCRSTLDHPQFRFPTPPIHLSPDDDLAVLAKNLGDNGARLLVVRLWEPLAEDTSDVR
jgi:hypothetical protein